MREPRYNSHPLTDAEFRESIGKAAGPATALHDEGIRLLLAADDEKALVHFDKAIAADPTHSNSYFAHGKVRFTQGQHEEARADFEEAIRLSQLAHDTYHHDASEAHLARAQKFLMENEFDLAITDCTKALDLNRDNKEARKTRAKAYRAKGNEKLAEEDEGGYSPLMGEIVIKA